MVKYLTFSSHKTIENNSISSKQLIPLHESDFKNGATQYIDAEYVLICFCVLCSINAIFEENI